MCGKHYLVRRNVLGIFPDDCAIKTTQKDFHWEKRETGT